MPSSVEPAHVGVATRAWTGPRGNWLLGCLNRFQTDPLNFYRETWQEYGDCARIRVVPGNYVYLFSHPEAVEHILYKHQKNYPKPDLFNKPVSLLAGNGILTSAGDFWRKQRRLIQPAFLKAQMGLLGTQVVSAVDETMSAWGSELGKANKAKDVVPEMMRLGLRIVSRALFSSDISSEADAVGRALRMTFGYVSRKMNRPFMPPLWVPTRLNREFQQQKVLLDRVVLQMIEARRSGTPRAANQLPEVGGKTQDVLDMLLTAQDEESGARMSDQQVKDEVLTLLIAGHETIGASLSWSWLLLGQHPEIQESLCDEVTGRMHGQTPTAADIPALPLATAVFEESMRLYPPAWGMPRLAVQEDEIQGFSIPRKSTVVLAQWNTHRHPAFWAEPDRFLPERFIGHEHPRSAYFPFGGGSRICIGQAFAMIEGPWILAAIAQRFKVSLVPNQEIVLDPTFTLRPRDGVFVTLEDRGSN